MKALPIAELLELPVEERIRLVKILWDSIAAVPEAVALPEEWKAELERRLAEFEADPEAGSPWDEVRSRIVQGKQERKNLLDIAGKIKFAPGYDYKALRQGR
jgi:putative addiction module component (TIGR02574 family)